MTAGAVLLEALKLVALWAAVSIGLGVCWVLVAIGAGLSRRATPAARAAAPRWLPQLDPRPHPMCLCAEPPPRHQRYLRGYWTPDGKRLTTLAGSPQVTSWFGFTDRELIAARQVTRLMPACDDVTLSEREATVTSIACLIKREGMKATRRAAGWN